MVEIVQDKIGVLPPEAQDYIASKGMKPRYNFWAKMASWTEEEAMALAVDIDPAMLRESLPQRMIAPIGLPLREVRELISRAVNAYELYSPTAPYRFVLWAKAHDVNVPAELERLIPVPEDRKPKAQTPIEKPLGTRERETLLKMIISMAVDKYKYDPQAEKSGGVTRIRDAVEKAGFKISDDTIRSKLQEAENFLSIEFSKDD